MTALSGAAAAPRAGPAVRGHPQAVRTVGEGAVVPAMLPGRPAAVGEWRRSPCDGTAGLSPGPGPCGTRGGIVLHPRPWAWLWPGVESPSRGALGPFPPGPARGAAAGRCSLSGRRLGTRIRLLQLVAVQADRQRARVALGYTDRAASEEEAGDAGAEFLSVPDRPSLSIPGAASVPRAHGRARPRRHHCRPRSAVGGTSEKHSSWELPTATATLLGWPERLLGQLGLGPGEGWQLSGIQCSQFCRWRFMGSRPGSLAFTRVPWHQNTSRRDGKNPRASEGKWRALTAAGARQSQFPPGRWSRCKSPGSASLACPQPAAILLAWP